MSVDFPSALRDSNVALPVELDIKRLIFLILIGHNGLFVDSLEWVSIGVVPCTCFVGFVIGELALVVCAVGKDPSAFSDWVVFPVSNELHGGLTVGVGSLALFFAEHPPAWVGVLVGIDVGAFAVLDAVLPLAWNKV